MDATKTVCTHTKLEMLVDVSNSMDSSIRASPKPTCRSTRQKNITSNNHLCVVCSKTKAKNVSQTFRICEEDCTVQFLEVTRYFQDEVFSKTSHLTDVLSVYAADVYYHNLCLRKYFRKYERERRMNTNAKLST